MYAYTYTSAHADTCIYMCICTRASIYLCMLDIYTNTYVYVYISNPHTDTHLKPGPRARAHGTLPCVYGRL
jgi:hypothetical protein